MPHLHADGPIFVRGVSRSGGTLVVTLLDSHSCIAMSYELYPTLLLRFETPAAVEDRAEYKGPRTESIPHDAEAVLGLLRRHRDLKSALGDVTDRNLRTYLARCQRSGLSADSLSGLLQMHLDSGLSFETSNARMRFMEACCRAKMVAQRKTRWGLKCSNQFEEYLLLWPHAAFINVIRDGRDVLASQLTTGSFDLSPEQIGQGWANTHQKFRAFAKKSSARTLELYYERLVRDPEFEARAICGFLGVPFEASMLRFHEQRLTIYSASHLSMDRIKRPIDETRIGRWRKELSDEQLCRFMSVAGETMAELGYM
jgi:hypothetical protein